MIKSPAKVDWSDYEFKIFLAGSIEMGVAEQWQERLAESLKQHDVTLLNPRRHDWDSSWVQSISNPQFSEQVTWELKGLEMVDMVVFYFDPSTKSPITLMELGYVLGSPSAANIVVCCPKGFWRKGNVDIICARNFVPVVETFEELVEEINRKLEK